MIKNYLLDVIGYSIALIVGIWIGKSIFTTDNINYQDKINFEMVTIKLNDSIKTIDNKIFKSQNKIKNLKSKSDTLIKKSKNIIIEKPSNKECEDLYKKTYNKISLLENNITVKDSIINIQDNVIVDKDNIIRLKDDIIKEDKEYVSKLEKRLQKSKPKFIIGPSIGYGIIIQDKPVLKPYVGISLTLNIF